MYVAKGAYTIFIKCNAIYGIVHDAAAAYLTRMVFIGFYFHFSI